MAAGASVCGGRQCAGGSLFRLVIPPSRSLLSATFAVTSTEVPPAVLTRCASWSTRPWPRGRSFRERISAWLHSTGVAGRRRASATPREPTAGPGSSWPSMPDCVRSARLLPTAACQGNTPCRRRRRRAHGSGRRFWPSCSPRARRRGAEVPRPLALPAEQELLGARRATWRSRWSNDAPISSSQWSLRRLCGAELSHPWGHIPGL